jgi:very-short-patch-repair endonuclease
MSQFPGFPIVSSDVSKAISDGLSGKVRSPEHIKNLSNAIQKGYDNGRQANKGKLGKPDSTETIEKKRKARTGKKHTQATKDKIGDGNRGKIMSPESIALNKASNALARELNGGGFATGPRSDEFKLRMSEIALARTPEEVMKYVERMLAVRRGSKATPEQRITYSHARLKWMMENPDKLPKRMHNTVPEREFEQELITLGLDYKKQYHTSKPHYLYDFLIEDKFLIEIDGPYHYNPKMHETVELFEKQVIKDAFKNLMAGQKGFYIYRIPVGQHLPNDWKDVLLEQDFNIDLVK